MDGQRRGRVVYGSVVLALVVFATAFVAVRESLGTDAIVALVIVNLLVGMPVLMSGRPKV
jgi:hypothetical protein